jgi:putative peptidoglycan lipid II flippase
MSTTTASSGGGRSLSRDTAVMAVGTMLSRITGFGRVFALGYALGYDRFSDSYTLANNAPNIVYELVLGGVLAATLVPVFVSQFAQQRDEDAWRAVSSIFTAAFALMLVATVVLVIGAPWVIDLYTLSSHEPAIHDERTVATFLLRLFAPQLLCYGFISVATGLLNARRVFAPPMFAPIFNNIAVIFVLLAVPHLSHDVSLTAMRHDTSGLLFLGLGTTAGVAAMALVLVPYVFRLSQHRLRWVWELRHPAVRTVVRLSGWTAGFVATNQIALLTNVVLANRGDGGDVTAFFSAYTFFILPHGIFTVSVMTALQTDMAEHWARQEVQAFRERVVLGLRVVTLVMAPAGVGYALLSQPVVSVILAHGHLSTTSANTTAHLLGWMVLGLPGFSAFILLTRALQSMQHARTVFWLYVVENGINVVTAVIFYYAFGLQGLAVSQSLAYTAAAVVALFVLRAKTHGLQGGVLVSSLVRILVATGVMAAVVAATTRFIPGNPLSDLVLGILFGAATFLGIAFLMRFPELQWILRRRGKPASPSTQEPS